MDNKESDFFYLDAMQSSPVKSTDRRRFGRFSVPADMAHEFSPELLRVMGQCIVFRAEHLFHSDTIEYWASSMYFRPVPMGEMVPNYRWIFTASGDLRAVESPP